MLTPTKVRYYDSECEEIRTTLQLDEIQQENALNCQAGHGCLAQLIVALTAGTLVTIVSGTVVLVGNSISWVEKKVTC